jgi:hypothetical protein
MSRVPRSICWIIFPNGTKLDAHKLKPSEVRIATSGRLLYRSPLLDGPRRIRRFGSKRG